MLPVELLGSLVRSVWIIPLAFVCACAAQWERRSGNVQGLQYVNQRARGSREQMTQAGLALRLEAAQALLALGHLEEAADAFSLLKAWTSEGEITFPYMAGIMPVSIRQQAARGLAQVRLPSPAPAGPPQPPVTSYCTHLYACLLCAQELCRFSAAGWATRACAAEDAAKCGERAGGRGFA